jgi:hypothetical protein
MLLFFLSACGGGGGGGGAMPATSGSLPAAVFTKSAVLPVAGLGDWNTLFSNGTGSRRFQALVRAQELQGSGPVQALAFHFAAASTGNSCPNVTIKLGHTSVTTLGTTFAGNVEQGRGALATVYGPATLTIPSGAAGDYFTIPLNGAFYYNGVDNLVVDITSDACTGHNVLMATAASPAYTALIYNGTDKTVATGNTWDSLAHMKFTFAGGDDKIDLGGAVSNSWPFANTTGQKPRIQNLYLASEINGSGPITGIAFQLNATSGAGSYTYTLKLGHSTLTALTTTFASNYSGSPATVANAVTFSIPANIPAGTWVWVPIPDGVFTYNGTDNLIVEVATSSGTADTNLRTAAVAGRRVAADEFGGAVTTGLVDGTAYHIALRFNGATVDVLPNGDATSSQVLGGLGAGQFQNLYKSVYLGTAGSITNIAVRMDGNANAATVPNAKIYMGHTTKTGLVVTDTYASNMTGETLVFNGTISVPAGLRDGDWLTIPLQTPFTYNGTENLVVLFTADAATALNSVKAHYSLTEFPNHAVSRSDNAVTTAGNPTFSFDGAVNLRLGIQK